MIGLTDRQREVLSLIIRLIGEQGGSPSTAEVAAELGVSRAAADQHIAALVRKGRLARVAGQARNIRVLDASEVNNG